MTERETLRPGGMELTRRMLGLACFQPGARVLDVCCGAGATVEELLSAGLDAWGVDLNPGTSPRVMRGSAAALPFDDASLDGIMCECGFSSLKPDAALKEFSRVMKTGGTLLISDLYSRAGGGGAGTPRLGALRVHTREGFEALLDRHGFELTRFEDCQDALKLFLARQIMEHGRDWLEEARASSGQYRSMKCGYCFLLARLGA